MAESLRLKILQRLTAHLEGIDGVDPYEHNLRGKVFRGRTLFGPSDPVPCISVLEGKATDYGQFADENQTVRKDSWLLLIQGWAKNDTLNPTDPLYPLVADVELRLSDINATEHGRAKFSGVYLLGGLISSLTIAAPVIRPVEVRVSDKAFFYLPVLVGLKSDLTNTGGR